MSAGDGELTGHGARGERRRPTFAFELALFMAELAPPSSAWRQGGAAGVRRYFFYNEVPRFEQELQQYWELLL